MNTTESVVPAPSAERFSRLKKNFKNVGRGISALVIAAAASTPALVRADEPSPESSIPVCETILTLTNPAGIMLGDYQVSDRKAKFQVTTQYIGESATLADSIKRSGDITSTPGISNVLLVTVSELSANLLKRDSSSNRALNRRTDVPYNIDEVSAKKIGELWTGENVFEGSTPNRGNILHFTDTKVTLSDGRECENIGRGSIFWIGQKEHQVALPLVQR